MKRVMIFAAGLGTRLRPLTDTMPKALVPYHGVPMLEILIKSLKSAGFDDFVINVHHFADMIEDFLALNNSFDVKIKISSERDLLRDTGGGIKHAAKLLDDGEPVLVHNVDIETNLDYSEVMSYHDIDSVATLIVNNRNTSRYLLFDNDNKLVGWMNKSSGEVKSPYPDLDVSSCKPYAFSGVHIISPVIYNLMKGWPESFSIIDFYLDICRDWNIKAKFIGGLTVKDLGKVEALK